MRVDPQWRVRVAAARRAEERAEEAAAASLGAWLDAPGDAALLAGDPNDGAHPDDHPASPPRAEPPSQTEMLNARLLESFRAALDAVGAEYGDEGDEEAGVEAMRAGLSAIRTVAGAPPPRRPDDDFDDDFDVI